MKSTKTEYSFKIRFSEGDQYKPIMFFETHKMDINEATEMQIKVENKNQEYEITKWTGNKAEKMSLEYFNCELNKHYNISNYYIDQIQEMR